MYTLWLKVMPSQNKKKKQNDKKQKTEIEKNNI